MYIYWSCICNTKKLIPKLVRNPRAYCTLLMNIIFMLYSTTELYLSKMKCIFWKTYYLLVNPNQISKWTEQCLVIYLLDDQPIKLDKYILLLHAFKYLKTHYNLNISFFRPLNYIVSVLFDCKYLEWKYRFGRQVCSESFCGQNYFD